MVILLLSFSQIILQIVINHEGRTMVLCCLWCYQWQWISGIMIGVLYTIKTSDNVLHPGGLLSMG